MPWIKDGNALTEAQVRAAHPNTSFPSPMEAHHVADFGYTWQDPVPVEPEPEPPRRVLRDHELRARFSQGQLVGIMRAGIAGDDVAMTLWLAFSTASDGVDLDKPEHVMGVHYIAATYPELAINPAVILA